MKRAIGLALAIGVLALSDGAAAQHTADTRPPEVTLVAMPIFGPDATVGAGWSDVVARVENTGSSPKKGSIVLTTAPGYPHSLRTKAPFHLPAGKSAIVRLPIGAGHGASVEITAHADDGRELATATVNLNMSEGPLLVDVDQPSRLAVVMRSWPIPSTWNPLGSASYRGSFGGGRDEPLSVGAPSVDPTTGDPILPEHAAGYSAATAVLVHSDALARLDPVALDALASWVLAGGALAVVPNRTEDLRGAVLTALVGGEISRTAPPARLLALPGAFPPPAAPPGLGPSPPEDDDADPTPAPGPAVPMALGAATTAPTRTPPIGPSPDVKRTLAGYAGGNLHPSDLGATAAYGLGEVHLLAFDPTTPAGLADPWVHARIVEMIGRAWDRGALSAFRHGASTSDYTLDDVRRTLDPNENFRPGLGVSAILLVIYSILAGPALFLHATRKGKPLRPLLWAPILSAGAFASIVVVGLATKGWHGRARRLSLVETGAGVTRGSVRRFRGFFASETRALTVRASDRTCVLEITGAEPSAHENAVLYLDRNGAALENLTGLPWQTVMIREDGFMDVGGGIAVLDNGDGSLEVVNRSGRALKNVLVWAPADKISFIPEIKDGTRVRSTAGSTVVTAASRRSATGTMAVHPLDARGLGHAISGKHTDPIAETWSPLEEAGGPAVDWWPDDVPVVMGELVGGEKTASDSGLSVERDRVLFRVVGKGGAL